MPAEGDARSEADRLERVYSGYDSSPKVRQRWSGDNPGNRAMREERERVLGGLLAEHLGAGLPEATFAELGCGWGHVLGWLEAAGVPGRNLVGVDVMASRLAAARLRYPDIRFVEADAGEPGLPAGGFDGVLCVTLFSSILDDAAAARVAAGAMRLLKPGGLLIWYDTRLPNPFNRHTRSFTRAQVRRLFPGYRDRLRSSTLLPPLARRLGPLTGVLYPVLARLPWLRSHYCGVLVKPDA